MPKQTLVGAAGSIGSAVISSRAQRKAQKRAESLAAEQERKAREEQLRLEEKFGLTPGELERQDRLLSLEKERQQELQRRAGLSGEDLLRQEGPITNQLLDVIRQRTGLGGPELFLQDTGQVGQQLFDEITGTDDELFNREFDLVLNRINQEANRRGVFGGQPEGGIRFENLGRAGVDFAIEKARERLNQRQALANTFLALSQGSRGEAGKISEASLGQSGLAREELANFLTNLQQTDTAARNRAANVGASGFGTTQRVAAEFGSVPIQFSAARFGEAAAQKNQALRSLGEFGGDFLSGPTGGSSSGGTTRGIEAFQNDLLGDPGRQLGFRTGASDVQRLKQLSFAGLPAF